MGGAIRAVTDMAEHGCSTQGLFVEHENAKLIAALRQLWKHMFMRFQVIHGATRLNDGQLSQL